MSYPSDLLLTGLNAKLLSKHQVNHLKDLILHAYSDLVDKNINNDDIHLLLSKLSNDIDRIDELVNEKRIELVCFLPITVILQFMTVLFKVSSFANIISTEITLFRWIRILNENIRLFVPEVTVISDENTKINDETIKLSTICNILVVHVDCYSKLTPKTDTDSKSLITYLKWLIKLVENSLLQTSNPKKIFATLSQAEVLKSIFTAILVRPKVNIDEENGENIRNELSTFIRIILFDDKNLLELAHSDYKFDDVAADLTDMKLTGKKRSRDSDLTKLNSQQHYSISLFDSLLTIVTQYTTYEMCNIGSSIFQIFASSSFKMASEASLFKFEKSKRVRHGTKTVPDIDSTNETRNRLTISQRRNHLVRIIRFSFAIISRFIKYLSPDICSNMIQTQLILKEVNSLLSELSVSLGGALPNHETFLKFQEEMLLIAEFGLKCFNMICNNLHKRELKDKLQLVQELLSLLTNLSDVDHSIVTRSENINLILEYLRLGCQAYSSFVSDKSMNANPLKDTMRTVFSRIIKHFEDLRRIESVIAILTNEKLFTINNTAVSEIVNTELVYKALKNAFLHIPLSDIHLYWESVVSSTSSVDETQSEDKFIDLYSIRLFVVSALAEAHRVLLSSSYSSGSNSDRFSSFASCYHVINQLIVPDMHIETAQASEVGKEISLLFFNNTIDLNIAILTDIATSNENKLSVSKSMFFEFEIMNRRLIDLTTSERAVSVYNELERVHTLCRLIELNLSINCLLPTNMLQIINTSNDDISIIMKCLRLIGDDVNARLENASPIKNDSLNKLVVKIFSFHRVWRNLSIYDVNELALWLRYILCEAIEAIDWSFIQSDGNIMISILGSILLAEEILLLLQDNVQSRKESLSTMNLPCIRSVKESRLLLISKLLTILPNDILLFRFQSVPKIFLNSNSNWKLSGKIVMELFLSMLSNLVSSSNVDGGSDMVNHEVMLEVIHKVAQILVTMMQQSVDHDIFDGIKELNQFADILKNISTVNIDNRPLIDDIIHVCCLCIDQCPSGFLLHILYTLINLIGPLAVSITGRSSLPCQSDTMIDRLGKLSHCLANRMISCRIRCSNSNTVSRILDAIKIIEESCVCGQIKSDLLRIHYSLVITNIQDNITPFLDINLFLSRSIDDYEGEYDMITMNDSITNENRLILQFSLEGLLHIVTAVYFISSNLQLSDRDYSRLYGLDDRIGNNEDDSHNLSLKNCKRIFNLIVKTVKTISRSSDQSYQPLNENLLGYCIISIFHQCSTDNFHSLLETFINEWELFVYTERVNHRYIVLYDYWLQIWQIFIFFVYELFHESEKVPKDSLLKRLCDIYPQICVIGANQSVMRDDGNPVLNILAVGKDTLVFLSYLVHNAAVSKPPGSARSNIIITTSLSTNDHFNSLGFYSHKHLSFIYNSCVAALIKMTEFCSIGPYSDSKNQDRSVSYHRPISRKLDCYLRIFEYIEILFEIMIVRNYLMTTFFHSILDSMTNTIVHFIQFIDHQTRNYNSTEILINDNTDKCRWVDDLRRANKRIFSSIIPRTFTLISRIKNLGNHLELIYSTLIIVFSLVHSMAHQLRSVSSQSFLRDVAIITDGVKYGFYQLYDQFDSKQKNKINTLIASTDYHTAKQLFHDLNETYHSEFKFIGKA